jgi:FixJ family two-component response regulator
MATADRRVVAIVDDDASLRRSLTNLLTSVGFRVETFASAEEFLRSSDRESIGCLVLDLRMGAMSGLELLRHLTATGSRIPVVVLTAHGDDDAREQALQAGAVAFLKKPFHSNTLLGAIRAAMDQSGRRS